MKSQIKILFATLFIIAAAQVNAQTIDSFHIERSVTPNELFVRLKFPDSSYYVERTFDRVALMYPPVNMVTFFYRSCEDVKLNPVMDTIIPIHTPDPYRLWVWLAADMNATSGCMSVAEVETVDSAFFDTDPVTSVINPYGNKQAVFQIFPNPATDILHVLSEPGDMLKIFDGLGRLMQQKKLQSKNEEMDISRFVPGMYYIRCYREGELPQGYCFSKLP